MSDVKQELLVALKELRRVTLDISTPSDEYEKAIEAAGAAIAKAEPIHPDGESA